MTTTAAATEWVSVAEAAVRLDVDPKTIQRRLAPGHRRHLRSRVGNRGTEVEVPAKATTAEVAGALTLHAEREIQLAGTIVASVERERRTMRSLALCAAAAAVVASISAGAIWRSAALREATLVGRMAEAERLEVALQEAEAGARYWRQVAIEERTARTLGQVSYIVRPDLLAAD